MRKQILLLITFLFTAVLTLNAQEWLTDFDTAVKRSAELNRPVILVFQGSDWCTPCIKLNKNIWSSEEFVRYSKDHYILLLADFPKKKANKLSVEQQEKNNRLFEKYNKTEAVPFVVVLDGNGKVQGTTGYKEISPSEYIGLLNSFIPEKAVQDKAFHRTVKLMGSRFDITVISDDPAKGEDYIDLAIAEISRIEKLISSWDPSSETSNINVNAGVRPVKVDAELFDLIERSIAISKLTDGAFDISYASMDNVWKFDGSMKEFPSEEAVSSSVSKVGYENIILDKNENTVYLKLKGMKIGFGGIGKGYAADKAKELLVLKGVSAGIINASGDMNTWGKQTDGEEWKVAITNPMNKGKAYGLLPVKNSAVVTSGDYEKFVTFNNKRYSHIIDPRTGYPATGMISATVFAPKAELADALATSIFVMGIEAGIDRIDQIPDVECIIVDESGNIHNSKNIRINQK